jgi:hypothetical protein
MQWWSLKKAPQLGTFRSDLLLIGPLLAPSGYAALSNVRFWG